MFKINFLFFIFLKKGKTRLRRQKHTQYIPFQLTDPLPTEPKALTCNYLKLKFISTEEYNQVKEMFDKRPIMSKMVVAYETQITNEKLKYILPTLAYYFTTGPWRIMWVRFGYDPRKDFESRYYQQLDYRIRLNSGIKGHVIFFQCFFFARIFSEYFFRLI